ncbi:MAG TPA: hypothetical protein VGH33_02560 [Isosphaeraceae bacterium]
MTELELPAAIDRPRPRWPAALIGALGLIVAVELGMARAGRMNASLTAADWRRVGPAATGRAATEAEVLCLGDSQVKTGVAAVALEARLDRTAYNLGMMAATPAGSYFVFKRALDAGARPRAIVLDAAEPQLWSYAYRDNVADWAELIGPAEALQLARDDRDPGLFGLFMAHYLVPSIRRRLDLRQALGDALAEHVRTPNVPWDPVIHRQLTRNRGGLVFSPLRPKDRPDPWPDGALPGDVARLWYRTGPFAHPTNLVYMEKLLALAESRGIAVLLLVAPIHPGTLAQRERLGVDMPYLAWLRGLVERHGNVTIVDGRHSGYDYHVFIDSCHLDAEGNAALSEALAEVIAARLEGSGAEDRWVALPRFASSRARLAVEDLDLTVAIVTWMRTRG